MAMSAQHVPTDSALVEPPGSTLAVSSRPTDPNNTEAWNAYFSLIVRNAEPDINIGQTYLFLVPTGDSDSANRLRERLLGVVRVTAARGILPGITLVFAGPDSARTSAFVTEAFENIQPGSFKDVTVLVIGEAVDKDKVIGALQRAGITARYANM